MVILWLMDMTKLCSGCGRWRDEQTKKFGATDIDHFLALPVTEILTET